MARWTVSRLSRSRYNHVVVRLAGERSGLGNVCMVTVTVMTESEDLGRYLRMIWSNRGVLISSCPIFSVGLRYQ